MIVQVDDGRGGSTQQRFVLSVTEPPPNRPPLFTSLPVVEAFVNTHYQYDADAVDPDGDQLRFARGNATVAIANSSFETPPLNDGAFTGTLTGWTIIGAGGAGTFNPAAQEYTSGAVADGQNVAYSNGATISQVLTELLQAGTRYILQVAVGDRLGISFPSFPCSFGPAESSWQRHQNRGPVTALSPTSLSPMKRLPTTRRSASHWRFASSRTVAKRTGTTSVSRQSTRWYPLG